MSTKQTEALKLALEALEIYPVTVNHWKTVLLPAAQALREALAEQPALDEDQTHYKKVIDDVQALFEAKRDLQPAQQPCDAPCGDIKCAVMCKRHEQPAQQEPSK